MSIISSIFKALFNSKPSTSQDFDKIIQQLCNDPGIAKAVVDAKSENDQICKIKKIFIDMPAWSDRVPDFLVHLDPGMSLNDLNKYSMSSFYHDIGSIVYWTLRDIRQEKPNFDIFDPGTIEFTLEELMKDLAKKTDNFESIDPQYIMDRVAKAKQKVKIRML